MGIDMRLWVVSDAICTNLEEEMEKLRFVDSSAIGQSWLSKLQFFFFSYPSFLYTN